MEICFFLSRTNCDVTDECARSSQIDKEALETLEEAVGSLSVPFSPLYANRREISLYRAQVCKWQV